MTTETELLQECKLQFEYLNEKFGETGTTNSLLAKLNKNLATSNTDIFAIIPKEKYDALLVALRGIRNSMAVHPDCEPDSEFNDMVSRCDEVLNDI